jgi:hypothetical protein
VLYFDFRVTTVSPTYRKCGSLLLSPLLKSLEAAACAATVRAMGYIGFAEVTSSDSSLLAQLKVNESVTKLMVSGPFEDQPALV